MRYLCRPGTTDGRQVLTALRAGRDVEHTRGYSLLAADRRPSLGPAAISSRHLSKARKKFSSCSFSGFTASAIRAHMSICCIRGSDRKSVSNCISRACSSDDKVTDTSPLALTAPAKLIDALNLPTKLTVRWWED